MKLSEILARVRDYPKLQRELEVAQKKAKEFEQKYEKAEKENDRMAEMMDVQESEMHLLRLHHDAYAAVLKEIGPVVKLAEEAKKLYECVAPYLDPQGFTLYRAAERITGFNLYDAFPYEDSCGRFERATGNELMRYLEADRFGGVSWEIVPGYTYECAELRDIDKSTSEYQAYEKQLYVEALKRLGFESLLFTEAEQDPRLGQENGLLCENEVYLKGKAMRRLMDEVQKGWVSAEENGWVSEEQAYQQFGIEL